MTSALRPFPDRVNKTDFVDRVIFKPFINNRHQTASGQFLLINDTPQDYNFEVLLPIYSVYVRVASSGLLWVINVYLIFMIRNEDLALP